MKMSKLEILANFGFDRDPFGVTLETMDLKRVKTLVKLAVNSKSMMAVTGERGSGKTVAIRNALSKKSLRVVKPITPDTERLKIADIETALILDLSNEGVRRNKEVRARQLRRILGEASRKGDIVLVLEEAHRMHGQTIRALKTLRELEWLGKSPLFTVIFVGQSNPLMKRGVDEVRLRADNIYMKGLTVDEAATYIETTVGKVWEKDGVEALARICSGKNFLDVQEMIFEAMECAIINGSKKISALEVFEKFGGGLKEVIKKSGISTTELANEVGLSKSTISLVMNEKKGTLTEEKFTATREAVANVLRRKLCKSGNMEAEAKQAIAG